MGKKNNKESINSVENKFKEFGFTPIGNKSNDPVDDAMQYAFMYLGKEVKPYVIDLEWFFTRIHCRCPEYRTVGFKEFFFLGKDRDDILDSVQLYDRETKDGRFYYVDKERYDKITKYLKPLTKKVYSPKDDCEIEIEVDDNGNPLHQKESEPTIQFDKDKPKFIKLGSRSINLKEIKEYSIFPTNELKILPDGTRGVNKGWGLMIWLYSGNGYWTINCGTKEEAEKMKEKLDNIIGVIDLEKEN